MKSGIVSFRLRDPDAKKLQETFARTAVVGISSPDKLARKIVVDFLTGRLVYLSRSHKVDNLELQERLVSE